MSVTINMNLYTKRERQILANQPGVTTIDGKPIDKLKVLVARNCFEKDWDIMYFRCCSVANALTQLSNYHPGPLLKDWVWLVPKTPSAIEYPAGLVYIRPVAYPERLKEYLEVIWNRPRKELMTIINLLQQIDIPGVLNLKLTSRDVNQAYWELEWTEPKFENSNRIFLHRG